MLDLQALADDKIEKQGGGWMPAHTSLHSQTHSQTDTAYKAFKN